MDSRARAMQRVLSVLMTAILMVGFVPTDAVALMLEGEDQQQILEGEDQQVELIEEMNEGTADQTANQATDKAADQETDQADANDLEPVESEDETIDAIAEQDVRTELLDGEPVGKPDAEEIDDLVSVESGDEPTGEAILVEGDTPEESDAVEAVSTEKSIEGESIVAQADATAAAVPITKAKAAKIADQAYTGRAVRPAVSLTYGGARLRAGTDYTVSYRNNTEAGTATATVTGAGGFSGTRSLRFRIVRPSVTYGVH
ncbi:MAG: hypothetical protein IKF14_10435, partial [Atopobiaceae bacterium]|nr:hypothetical protein [Atopobiaceae bacterium]